MSNITIAADTSACPVLELVNLPMVRLITSMEGINVVNVCVKGNTTAVSNVDYVIDTGVFRGSYSNRLQSMFGDKVIRQQRYGKHDRMVALGISDMSVPFKELLSKLRQVLVKLDTLFISVDIYVRNDGSMGCWEFSNEFAYKHCSDVGKISNYLNAAVLNKVKSLEEVE